MSNHRIAVRVNGHAVDSEVESRLLLVDFLREKHAFNRDAHRLRHEPLRGLHSDGGWP